MTQPPRSPRTARPCPTSARRPAPILSSRYPGDPAKPAHRAPTLAARPTNAAAPRPTLDRTPSATRHLPAQQPRSLPAEKSPNGTASENLGASRKPPPAFSAPSHLERRRTSAPRTRLFWNSQSAGAAQTLRAVRKSRLVDLTPMTFSCGAGSPNPSTKKGRSRPRPLQRLVRSRKDLPRGPWRLAPLWTRKLRVSTQPPPRRRRTRRTPVRLRRSGLGGEADDDRTPPG